MQRLASLSGSFVPIDRREILEKLAEPLVDDPPGPRPAPEDTLHELIKLGVLRERDDGRLDVPDIYRSGYGIKRRGGVQRPR